MDRKSLYTHHSLHIVIDHLNIWVGYNLKVESSMAPFRPENCSGNFEMIHAYNEWFILAGIKYSTRLVGKLFYRQLISI